ncbi:hypothetical protein [Nannocystis pusilla]|uniref:hypothetical protein n=1 Tax=Nannocystis pusilla TaxID=889268 RepID=UPI003B7E10AD
MLPGSPAEKVGLQPGDSILKIAIRTSRSCCRAPRSTCCCSAATVRPSISPCSDATIPAPLRNAWCSRVSRSRSSAARSSSTPAASSPTCGSVPSAPAWPTACATP